MNVCMLGYTFYETDNRVRRYAEALSRAGHTVDAIVIGREGQPSTTTIAGVDVFRIQKRVRNEASPLSYLLKMLAFFLRSSWALAALHWKKRYDVVHVHSVPDFQVFAAIVPKLMGARVILDIHDIVPEFYASKFKVSERSMAFRILIFLEKISIAFSNHTIISNELWRRKLVSRSVSTGKCTAIINYPDPTIFFRRGRTSSSDGRITMCYPGTLNWHQGIDIAIQALALLRNTASNVHFLIVGDGPCRKDLIQLAKELNLEDKVSFREPVPMEEVAAIMANVDIGVVPKRSNSFGNEAFSTKIMEFMSMGVPVIAARTAIDQHYFDENIVRFFESGDAADLAAKIAALAESAEQREILRGNADVFIAKNGWDVKQAEYMDVLNQTLAGRSRAARSATTEN